MAVESWHHAAGISRYEDIATVPRGSRSSRKPTGTAAPETEDLHSTTMHDLLSHMSAKISNLILRSFPSIESPGIASRSSPESESVPPRPPSPVPIVWSGATFSDLPAELVNAILCDFCPSEILAFALVCRAFYPITIPLLNHSIIVSQQDAPTFLYRVSSKDPRNELVRCVQLGRLDRPGYGERWNVADVLPLLAAFPGLRELETCGGTYVQGCLGFNELSKVVGDRLVGLRCVLRQVTKPGPTVCHTCI